VLAACGRQLDRQRQPVELAADLGHRRRVFVRHGEISFHRLSTIDKQPHRFVLGQLLEGRQVASVRQRQRRNSVFALAGEVQHDPAGHQYLEAGRSSQQLCYHQCGVQHLLEVVEHQQYSLLAQIALEDIEQRSPTLLPYAQRLGDGCGDQLGIADWGQVDKPDTISKLVK
jgi:hypothetical protein